MTARLGRRLFYGWVMVAVAFGVILIGAATRAAPGALLLPIQGDTGWTVGQVTMYVWIYAAHMHGAAMLAQVAAVIRDQAGDYTLAYLTAGWMAVAAGIVILALRRAGRPSAPLAA